MVQDQFWKEAFLTNFTHFCTHNSPFSRNIGISMGQTPSKWAQNGLKTLVRASQMVPGLLLEKCVFDPLLVLKRPIFKAYWDFPWAKTRDHGLKTG